jgi:hypothetical protein
MSTDRFLRLFALRHCHCHWSWGPSQPCSAMTPKLPAWDDRRGGWWAGSRVAIRSPAHTRGCGGPLTACMVTGGV